MTYASVVPDAISHVVTADDVNLWITVAVTQDVSIAKNDTPYVITTTPTPVGGEVITASVWTFTLTLIDPCELPQLVVTTTADLAYDVFLSEPELKTIKTALIIAPSINVVCDMTYATVIPSAIGSSPVDEATRVTWDKPNLQFIVPVTKDATMASSTAWTVTALPSTPGGEELTDKELSISIEIKDPCERPHISVSSGAVDAQIYTLSDPGIVIATIWTVIPAVNSYSVEECAVTFVPEIPD
jgi:hypothetical protein